MSFRPSDELLAGLDDLLDRFDDEHPDLVPDEADDLDSAHAGEPDDGAGGGVAAEATADALDRVGHDGARHSRSDVSSGYDSDPASLEALDDHPGLLARSSAPPLPDGPKPAIVVDADLPPLRAPSGYWRDGAGRWRYESTGEFVPGARDVTLARLHRFERCGCTQHLLIPESDLERPELDWARSATEDCPAQRTASVLRWGSAVAAVAVPVGEWEARCQVALGLDAPELTASELLDPTAVGLTLGGLSPRTVSAYLARGVLPEPVARVGGVPLWSRGVLLRWAASRPGQGRNVRRGPTRRTPKR